MCIDDHGVEFPDKSLIGIEAGDYERNLPG
jgi:hypothetical protein